MTTITIRDIPIQFPFTPYPIQRDYMEKVIECLETQKNGILESPTGTGKTLSLLCASLAWLQARKKQRHDQLMSSIAKSFDDESCNENGMENSPLIIIPKIIYASRTHSQLHQAMQEMKKTAYNKMKACVLGSRNQMCIDPEVQAEKNSSFKINLCRSKVKARHCHYFNRVENQRDHKKLCDMNIVDMEDIVDLGKSHSFCPYYMARELKSQADVIFMPYNYLLDLRMTKKMSDEICNGIIIIDEAHNIEKVCEESVSTQIKTTDLDSAIQDLSVVMTALQNTHSLDVEDIQLTPLKLQLLMDMFINLKKVLQDLPLIKLALEGTVFDGDHIFHILEKSGIVEANHTGIIDLIDNVLDFLAATKQIQRSGYALELLNNLLFVVFNKTGPEFRQKMKECFKVQIEEEQTEKLEKRRFSQMSQMSRENCRVLNLWCFNPGFGMNMLIDKNVRCVILTSGTLAPLRPLMSELDLHVEVQIENPHIVDGNQVCVKILSCGPDKELLNSNFQNRNNPKYMLSLGLVISNLVRIIPDGVLIFFPSYFIMEKTIEHWHNSGVWDAINRIKPIYTEPKDKISFDGAIVDYYSKIQDSSCKGAIFMGVCRGKVSEGLDFADVNGRAVFITGLPYPPLKDPKIILKKKYLDFRNSKDREYLTGDDWYGLEATRAVNQAIGRVIRHKNDYGAIILLDSRFSNARIKNNLSLWLRRHVSDVKNFREIVTSVRQFFQNVTEKMPQFEKKSIAIPELKNLGESSTENFVKIHPKKPDEIMGSPSKRFK